MVNSHYHLLFALEISEEHCEHLKYRKAKKKEKVRGPRAQQDVVLVSAVSKEVLSFRAA